MHLRSHLLPSSLLDLSLNQIFTQARFVRSRSLTLRAIHQAALSPKFSLRSLREVGELPSPQTSPTVASEIKLRVDALQSISPGEDLPTHDLSYSEELLSELYENLLALPSTLSEDKTITEFIVEDNDAALVESVFQRMVEAAYPFDLPGRFSSSLTRGEGATSATSTINKSPDAPLYHRILTNVQELTSHLTSSMIHLFGDQPLQKTVPVTILTYSEWAALIRVAIRNYDGDAAELALQLMKSSRLSPTEESVNYIMEFYADAGNVLKIEQFIEKFLNASPTPQQRRLHIKSKLRSTPPRHYPTSAVSLLHKYESQSLPAPVSSYRDVITALFATSTPSSSLAHVQAWDLFAHMRYVAHPYPDVKLYATMIRACAGIAGGRSAAQPERALDLWTEMTVDRAIQPTTAAYNAIILACARSGEEAYVREAFRLAKQMLDANRDARGFSAHYPDRFTFYSLLEGTKRLGDLSRARAILAELVKVCMSQDGESLGIAPDEEVMMHMFHTYAAYRPPYIRRTKVVKGVASSGPKETEESSAGGDDAVALEDKIDVTFSRVPPQNRAEILAEVKALLSRILADNKKRLPVGLAQLSSSSATLPPVFHHVKLTPRLVNSYLSIYYVHSTLDVARDHFRTLFDELGVSRNARSYVEALERCTLARNRPERAEALVWAEELWKAWQEVEERSSKEEGTNAREIERAHVAMIRVLSLTSNMDRAIRHVRSFVQRYPPSSLRDAPTKDHSRSSRTVLFADRPLVRLISAVAVPDDTVPPLLTFVDLEILHGRLVKMGRHDLIGYIKWVCMAYRGSLRKRRDILLKTDPSALRKPKYDNFT